MEDPAVETGQAPAVDIEPVRLARGRGEGPVAGDLDEVVEARKDTVVIIHPLTDHRRRLPIEKRGTILEAPSDFMLVVSYNPGYQSILKDLKQSTRQRFVVAFPALWMGSMHGSR